MSTGSFVHGPTAASYLEIDQWLKSHQPDHSEAWHYQQLLSTAVMVNGLPCCKLDAFVEACEAAYENPAMAAHLVPQWVQDQERLWGRLTLEAPDTIRVYVDPVNRERYGWTEMFSQEPLRSYWMRLFSCIHRRGVDLAPPALTLEHGVISVYDSLNGSIAYIRGLDEQETAMVITKEFAHAEMRPASRSAVPITDKDRIREEHIAHKVAASIAEHFDLGDHYAKMVEWSVPYLDPTTDELHFANDLGARLIKEIEAIG